MSTPKATPAPWRLKAVSQASPNILDIEGDGRLIAFTAANNAESRGNATLMASAPELYEALKAAEALATCCMAQGCYSHDELAEMARATKPAFTAALARARGEEVMA